uniref:Histone deacetylase domain-containing protein n=1 Tax=Graphocephala atropunctata TaxID=36148 RepID=A0A1B6MPN6_9HEMI
MVYRILCSHCRLGFIQSCELGSRNYMIITSSQVIPVLKVNRSYSESKVWPMTDKQQDQIYRLKGLPIIHHHGYVCDLPPKHRFPMPKFHKVFDFLEKDGIIHRERQLIEPSQIVDDVACNVHTPEYIDKFFNGKTDEVEQRATGFVWTAGLASRVRYETGGTLLAAQLSLERGLACSTAGGTHHAFPDRGAGFCLINDLAIAAQQLINTQAVSRVLIVDLDVHQGDGTAFIFRNTEAVFTFSMHCGKNFPFRKQNSDLDVPLEVGIDDNEFLSILQEHLPHILDTFRPDLVLYDAGVDPHKDDELGKLNLTDAGLFKRDEYVLNQVLKRGVPVATVIGGGYSEDIDQLALRHTIVHRAATRVWGSRGL